MVEPVFVSVPGVEGAVVSPPPAQALVAAESEVLPERFPAASYASTASVYVVPHVRPEKVETVTIEEPAVLPFR
jgi:hypothetical protein